MQVEFSGKFFRVLFWPFLGTEDGICPANASIYTENV